jgi:hypothetical protein
MTDLGPDERGVRDGGALSLVPITLFVVGLVLLIVSIPLYGTKPAFWSMIACGSAAVVTGVVLFVLDAQRAAARRAYIEQQERKAHALRRAKKKADANKQASLAETSNATVSAAVPTIGGFVLPSPSRRTGGGNEGLESGSLGNGAGVTWMDDNKPDSPLSAVKEFRTEEPVKAVRDALIDLVPDHPPKAVPAVSVARRLSLGYEKPYVCPGAAVSVPYAQAGVNVVDVGALNPESANECTAPMFYTPPSQYPTVDDIATERQRFWCRPETPETDRARREGLLKEASFLLGPPNDRSMVPVGIVPTLAAGS